MSKLARQYSKDGFVHLKQVLDPSELDEIRKLIKSSGSGGFVKEISFFLEHKTLYQHQFNSKILEHFKKFLVKSINL